MSRCSWCNADQDPAAARRRGPHATWCPLRQGTTDFDALAAAEKRGYERGSHEMFIRGVSSLGDLWSQVLGPILTIKRGLEELEATHNALFNVVEGRAEGAPSLFDLPALYWSSADGTWPKIREALQREIPLLSPAARLSLELNLHPVLSAAEDIVALWTSQKFRDATDTERALAIDGARVRLTEAVNATKCWPR